MKLVSQSLIISVHHLLRLINRSKAAMNNRVDKFGTSSIRMEVVPIHIKIQMWVFVTFDFRSREDFKSNGSAKSTLVFPKGLS